MSFLRVWVETKWFQKFWNVKRDYARQLALKNEEDRRQRRKNTLPVKGHSTWDLVRELVSDGV